DSVIHHFCTGCSHGKYMVVAHIKLTALVIMDNACVYIVTWININTVVKDMGGGISCVDMGDQGQNFLLFGFTFVRIAQMILVVTASGEQTCCQQTPDQRFVDRV